MDKNMFGGYPNTVFSSYDNVINRGGSSDPLVKVKITGTDTKRTKIVYKNLNPVWYALFWLTLPN